MSLRTLSILIHVVKFFLNVLGDLINLDFFLNVLRKTMIFGPLAGWGSKIIKK